MAGSNTAVGYNALANNIGGAFNTAIGGSALYANTGGGYNAAFGQNALLNNTDGADNTACGSGALFYNTQGNFNTALGNNTLLYNTTGSRNTGVGYLAGRYAGSGAGSGDDNIFLGSGAGGTPGDTHTIRIGGTTVGTAAKQQDRTFINGIRGVTTGVADAITVMIDSSGQLGTISSSRRTKKDISDMDSVSERLLHLRPVTFRYKKEFGDGTTPIQFGLIAEEVAEVFPELVVYDRDGRPETVKYHLLSSLLVNELKKAQASQARDRAKLEALYQRLGELEEVVREAGVER